MAEYDSILLIIKAVIGVIGVAGLTVYVLRPLFKSFSGLGEQPETPGTRLKNRLQEEELEIPTSEPREITQQLIVKKALEDPIRTTQLVRNWLREKK